MTYLPRQELITCNTFSARFNKCEEHYNLFLVKIIQDLFRLILYHSCNLHFKMNIPIVLIILLPKYY